MIATLLALLAVVNVANPSVTYACNGVTAVYTVNFPYLAYTDLLVTSTTPAGVPTTLAYTTDFSVNLASTSSTATLTLNAPGTKCPSGNLLKVARNLSLTQPYSFKAQSTYNQNLHETAYDREVMLIQQTDAKVSSTDVKSYVDAAIAATLTGGTVVSPITWALVGDGATLVFSIPNAVVSSPDLYVVTIDGLVQAPATDYSVSSGVGQITFVTAPAFGAAIVVRSTGYARALSVGDSTSVLATGTSVPRDLAHWLSDSINVKACGAIGDGSTNDTALVQACATIANSAGKALFFPPGTYSVTNLTHGTTPWIGVPRQSIIKARAGGDAGYLVASGQWLVLLANTASSPWVLVDGIDFDANGLKTYSVVARTYFTKFHNCQFKGSTDTDLLFSTDARDGTLLASTMVNNEVLDSWIGADGVTAQYGIRTVDTNNKATDYKIVNNYFSGSSVVNLWALGSAGWVISENHFYGSGPSSVYLYKPNVGTIFSNNYLEKEGRFGSPNTSATTPFTYGPGNYFSTHVWADFNGTGNTIVSTGNTYSTTAEVRHAFFSASKILVSKGDTFGNATPFKHYASAGGAVQDASTGKFQVLNATLLGVGTLSALFDGSGSAATGIMHRQTSWANAGFQSSVGWDSFANLGTPPNGVFMYCYDCTIANPCAGAGTGALAKRLNGVWVCN